MTRKTQNQLRANVMRGVALLDRRQPAWWKKIDLDAFDLTSGQRCICGQLDALRRTSQDDQSSWYSGFLHLIRRSHVSTSTYAHAVQYGFTVNNGDDGEWEYTEGVWRREIQRRRREAAQAAA